MAKAGFFKLLNENEEPVIRTATTYVILGEVDEAQLAAIKNHCINPVDSRETGLEKPQTLIDEFGAAPGKAPDTYSDNPDTYPPEACGNNRPQR